jgi:hypothetical protein
MRVRSETTCRLAFVAAEGAPCCLYTPDELGLDRQAGGAGTVAEGSAGGVKRLLTLGDSNAAGYAHS